MTRKYATWLSAAIVSAIAIGSGSVVGAETEKKTYEINKYRSLIIVDNEILDPDSFSFEKTIKHIIKAERDGTPGPCDEGATADEEMCNKKIKALVQTLLDSFTFKGKENPDTPGYFMDVVQFSSVACLQPEHLLGKPLPKTGNNQANYCTKHDYSDVPKNKYKLVPTAIVNRFDLAPKSFSDCGEYRIVYSFRKINDNSDPILRFFLIFEARVPNLVENSGPEGCRGTMDFWADLSDTGKEGQAKTRKEIRKRLVEFFYDMTPSGGDRVIRMGALDGANGQIRGSIQAYPDKDGKPVMKYLWQMREWNIGLLPPSEEDASNKPAQLAFIVTPLRNNPLVELYEDLSVPQPKDSPPDTRRKRALDHLKAVFRDKFLEYNLRYLIDPDPDTDDTIVKNGDWLINNLGLRSLCELPKEKIKADLLSSNKIKKCNHFYEFQSTMAKWKVTKGKRRPHDDSLLELKDNQKILLEFKNKLKKATTYYKTGKNLTPEMILRRAEALSCSGCHLYTSGETISLSECRKNKFNPCEIIWPPSTENWHVQERRHCRRISRDCKEGIDECSRQCAINKLSFALRDTFLKFRKRKFEKFDYNKNKSFVDSNFIHKIILVFSDIINKKRNILLTESFGEKFHSEINEYNNNISILEILNNQQSGAFVLNRRAH